MTTVNPPYFIELYWILLIALYWINDKKIFAPSPLNVSQIESERNDWAARAIYEINQNTTGWDTLEIETSKNYPDEIQAKAAGIAEGHLTKDSIHNFYLNIIQEYCNPPFSMCNEMMDFIKENTEWSNQMIRNHSQSDPYWFQLKLMREQLDGVLQGYYYGSPEEEEFTMMDLLMINAFQDLADLKGVLRERSGVKGEVEPDHCTLYVKYSKNDILFAHTTWTDPATMLRILKHYKFPYKMSPTSNSLVPSQSISMSSYPGMIYSMDDFFITSTGLAITETTIRFGGYNKDLGVYVVPKNALFTFERVMIVNRLASNGTHWASLYLPNNMGTFNNQWAIIDYKALEVNSSHLVDGVLWVVEQLPGTMIARDQTEVLRQVGYLALYNLPYLPEMSSLLRINQTIAQFGDYFDEAKTPRARIFARENGKVVDLASMTAVMRFNDFPNDPLSRCEECVPPYSGVCAISSRTDLNPRNGTYPFPAMGSAQPPATDLKVTNSQLALQGQFQAISGPTFDPLPPFGWETAPEDIKNKRHFGLPPKFTFGPVIPDWNWSDITI